MPVIEQLRSFRALQGFSMQQLASVAAQCEECDAVAGDVIFREKEDSRSMAFLLEGLMEVRFHGKHIAEVPPLSLVGEMGVIDKEPRSASLIALSNCRYLSLPRDDFQRLIEEDNDMGMKFYRNICCLLMEQLRKNNLLVEYVQTLGQ